MDDEFIAQNIRFVASLNNLDRINRTKEDQAFLSRFTLINFDPLEAEERTFLKDMHFAYLKYVAVKVNFEVKEETLLKLVSRHFPNLRAAVMQLQELTILGEDFLNKGTDLGNVELYEFLCNGHNDVSENYFYVLDNYRDNTESLLLQLGRTFFLYIQDKYPHCLSTAGSIWLKLLQQYNAEYSQVLDPELHLIALINDLKTQLNLK
jgi:hypothetical protein